MPSLIARCLAGLFVAITTSGCALICLSRQHSGPVKTLTGVVQPSEVITIDLPYDARGSQNDLKIAWDGQRDVTGPRPAFYLTEAGCLQFVPPAANQRFARDAPCRTIGSRGGFQNSAGEIVVTRLGVVGGPNQGPLNALRKTYKLQIVGDATRPVRYVIEITWFRGPNC
jgi:hypothetical protein